MPSPCLSEVAVAVIDGVELAAVDGNDRLGEEVEVAAKRYELSADTANGLANARCLAHRKKPLGEGLSGSMV